MVYSGILVPRVFTLLKLDMSRFLTRLGAMTTNPTKDSNRIGGFLTITRSKNRPRLAFSISIGLQTDSFSAVSVMAEDTYCSMMIDVIVPHEDFLGQMTHH